MKGEKKSVVVTGYDIRRLKDYSDRWVSTVHVQATKRGAYTKYTDKAGIEVSFDPRQLHQSLENKDVVGRLVEAESKQLLPYRPWQCNFGGIGKVRGHSVTYSKKYGLQRWVIAEVFLEDISEWRNLPVLLDQEKYDIWSTETLAELRNGLYSYTCEHHPFGSVLPMKYVPRMRRHVFDETVAPVVDMDRVLRTELSAGSAG